jgi:hypothetical protein
LGGLKWLGAIWTTLGLHGLLTKLPPCFVDSLLLQQAFHIQEGETLRNQNAIIVV